jgi:predicted HTH domain antitoxin
MAKPKIDYPAEILWALQQEANEFARDARLILAVDLYQSGKLSTGLAAKLANLPIGHFLYELSRRRISPYGTTVDELATDVENALAASRQQ